MDSRKGWTRTALLATAVLGLLWLLPAQASASHVQCGDTITQDTTLDSDLMDCPGHGLVVGANNVTLNLGGHTIDGIVIGGNGIYNAAGYNGVTIENGRVQEFGIGIRLINRATNNTIRFVEVASNQREGIDALFASDNAVLHSYTHDNGTGGGGGFGILLGRGFGANSLIQENRVIGNPATGIFADSGNVIVGNVVADSGNGIGTNSNTVIKDNSVTTSGRNGIFATGTQNVIEGNTTLHNGLDGIFLFGLRNRLARNVASDNGDDGIEIDTPRNRVVRNTVNRNGDLGIEAVPGTSGGGNRAFGNGNPLQCLNVVCK